MNFDNNSCPSCYKSFSRKDLAKRHYLERHLGVQRLAYKCSRCPKKFSKKHLVRVHERNIWTGKRSIFPNGLEDLLKSVPDGQMVLSKQFGLDNCCRGKLVKIIIDYLILQKRPDIKFPTILYTAAEEIVNLFPRERLETYYQPYSKTNKTIRGKLYSRWVNSKTQFRNMKSTKGKTPQPPVDSIIELSEIETGCYNAVISSGDEPYEVISQEWKGCYNYRMKLIEGILEPSVYFDKFPVLHRPFGYQLLVDDFNLKFPQAGAVSVHKVWPRISSAVDSLLKTQQSVVQEATMSSQDNILMSLKQFPFLFSSTTYRRKSDKKMFKLSKAERANSFLLHVTSFETLEQKILDRTEKLKDCHTTMHPFLVAVGPPNCVQAFFAIFGNQKYFFSDGLAALDTVFKMFHALNVEYPKETLEIWQTIDQLVYKVCKSINPGAGCVLSEIESKLDKM